MKRLLFLLLAATSTALAAPDRPRAARSPQEREHKIASPYGTDFVFEPRAAGPRPVAIFLHALCGAAWHWAYTLEDLVSSRAWMVSPEANHDCHPGASWSGGGATVAKLIEDSLARTRPIPGGGVDETAPRVLMGFSQGAWVALDVAKARRGTYRGLLLMAMDLKTSAGELRAAGVERVVLAAGDKDGSVGSMRRLAATLGGQGFPARFVSLGAVGHTIPLDGNERLREAFAWLAETLVHERDSGTAP